MSAGGIISMSKQFGVDFYSEVVVVSLCTKDAQIVHGGLQPRNENDLVLGGGPIRVLGGRPNESSEIEEWICLARKTLPYSRNCYSTRNGEC